ncbi:DUF427 domain-containing protein [Paracoccaceae bacterium Fryx2]|nr:DUF427 domain-containing protein [Paracoccaceae bacterium Fryx2]
MSETIHLRKAPGTWIVRADGAIIGQTSDAVELTEGAAEPVIYIPRADIAMQLFDPSETRSTCPLKGEARYFTFVSNNGTIRDAGWSYEAPKPELAAISGHLAFDQRKTMVQQIQDGPAGDD